MKKTAMFLLVALVAFQALAFAGTIEGTVKSVDASASTLEVASDAGSSTVTYSDVTTWPAGVTDPASLVDKQVKVNTDDATGAAVSVEEVVAA